MAKIEGVTYDETNETTMGILKSCVEGLPSRPHPKKALADKGYCVYDYSKHQGKLTGKTFTKSIAGQVVHEGIGTEELQELVEGLEGASSSSLTKKKAGGGNKRPKKIKEDDDKDGSGAGADGNEGKDKKRVKATPNDSE